MSDDETSAELALHDACSRGAMLDANRAVIRAEVLRSLLVSTEEPAPRSLDLANAIVAGPLDLRNAVVRRPLLLRDCELAGPLRLADASIRRLEIRGGTVPQIAALGLHVESDLVLGDGLRVSSGLQLNRARIDGKTRLSGLVLGAQQGRSLQALRARFGGGIDADDMRTDGAVELRSAEIHGDLILSGSKLRTARKVVLYLGNAFVNGDVHMGAGFMATGQVRLSYARVEGSIALHDGHVFASADADPSMRQFHLEGVTVGADVTVRRSTVQGPISAIGSRISGDVLIQRSSAGTRALQHQENDAVTLDRAHVDGNVHVIDDSLFMGSFSLTAARIGGQVVLSGSLVLRPNGIAVNGSGANVAGSFHCVRGFNTSGTLNLLGATVGTQLLITDSRFESQGEVAIDASDMTVGTSFILGNTVMLGDVDLSQIRVGGSLLVSGDYIAPGKTAIRLMHANIGRELMLMPTRVEGDVDLTHCVAASFYDHPARWPKSLALRGFRYEAIDEGGISAAERLSWLGRDEHGYSPQPYEQLIAAYRRSGWEEDARTVAIAKRRRRRQELPRASRAWDVLLDRGIAYGYATWRAVVGLLVLATLGAVVFTSQYPQHFTAAKTGKGVSQPPFHAITYTLDVLVPVISLRQRDAWTPDGYALWWSVGLTFLGWVLTTAVVAALTGLLRRD